MNLAILFLIMLGAVLLTITIIEIVRLTLPKLKEIIKKRKEKKKRQKVVFGSTEKIIDKDAKEILKNAPKMTMDDLEKMCEETPYFVVDYDPETEQITSEFEGIKPETVEEDVKDFLDDQANDGIILFD